MLSKRLVIILNLLFVLSILSACNKPATPTVTQTQGESVESPTLTVTETSVSTLVPQSANQVLLWSPPGSNPALNADLESTLYSLLGSEGMELINVESIAPGDLTPNVKAVVALASAEGLDALAAYAPSIEFLSVGTEVFTAGSNLSVIALAENNLEQKAFMAGYLSVLITDDYRAGVLVQSGAGTAQTVSESFFVGARYLCGLCNARFAPVEYYPKIAEISDPKSQTEWQFAVDLMRNQGVQTILVQPELVSAPLLDYLSSVDVSIILLDSNPNSVTNPAKIAIIKNDYQSALSEIWPSIFNNEGGRNIEPGLVLETESDWISEGRLRLFYSVLDDLEAGFIKPGPIN